MAAPVTIVTALTIRNVIGPARNARHLQVGSTAGKQLPGWPAIVERDRQPLHMPVEMGPHRRLDLGHRAGGEPAPHTENARLADAEQQQPEPAQQHSRWIAAGDRTIYQPLQYQRHGQAEARGKRRQQGGRRQPRPGRPDIRPEAHEGAQR